MRIASGRMDKRVTIQAQSATRDDLNQKVLTWAAITNGEVWAAVEPVSARESQQAAASQMSVSHRVTIAYRPDVTAEMRVQYGSRQFAIVGIRNPLERGEVLELICEESRNV